MISDRRREKRGKKGKRVDLADLAGERGENMFNYPGRIWRTIEKGGKTKNVLMSNHDFIFGPPKQKHLSSSPRPFSPFFRAHAYVAVCVFAHPLQKRAERRGEREAPSSKKCRHRTNGALLAHPAAPPLPHHVMSGHRANMSFPLFLTLLL